MQKKFVELLAIVHNIRFWQASPDGSCWIQFTDAFDKRTLCDENLESLITRAHALATLTDKYESSEQSIHLTPAREVV